MDVNPARLGIPRLQPGKECGVTRGRSRYCRGPPAPAGGGSTVKKILNNAVDAEEINFNAADKDRSLILN